MREIRRLPEKEVIRQWAALYAAGKHAKHLSGTPNASHYIGRDDTWVEVEIPHDLYNADWNTDSEATLSETSRARAEKYALLPGKLPPGMASFRGVRRGRSPRAFVSDGNHRAYAAYLRNDPSARFYMPLNEWEKFKQAVEG